jgi:NADPH-dependent curcumin reductase CurA
VHRPDCRSLQAWTAYIGLLKIGNPKPTDKCVVVSGAAGATGSSVTQIAKNVLGIERVVGIAGTAKKCKMLTSQCGCDVALNYKSPNFEQELKEATPGFIDIYFDNTGGRILDLCVKRMKEYGRVVSCGAISAYDKDASTAMSLTAESYFLVVCLPLPENNFFGNFDAKRLDAQVTQKLIIQGFVVIEPRFEKDLEECEVKLTEWASEGKLKPLKTVWKAGFDEVPGGMIKLLRGENTGKLVTELKDRGASTL